MIVCLRSCLNYPACTVHAPYYSAICVRSGCTIFITHYIINGTIFGKKVIEHKNMCLVVSTKLCLKYFLIVSRNQQDIIIKVHRFSRKVPVILVRFQ